MSHEKELDRIRKDPANRVCPNCLKEDKMGFDAVCWAFKTFVCSSCKSSHQAYSHRCKSVRMSNWTRDEVEQLKTEKGGGNAMCQATWLGNLQATGGPRPKPGDEDKVFKRFVDDAYNNRMYYKEGGVPSAPATLRQQSAAVQSSAMAGSPLQVNRHRSSYAASGGGAADLLGGLGSATPATQPAANASADPFGGMDPFASGGGAGGGFAAFGSAPQPAAVPTASSSTPAFQADFGSAGTSSGTPGGFGSFSSAPTPAAPQQSNGNGVDLFANFASPATTTATPAALPPPGVTSGLANNSNANNNGFGLTPQPASAPQAPTATPDAAKANIMAAFNASSGPPKTGMGKPPPAAVLDPADFGGSRPGGHARMGGPGMGGMG
eukprot:CAMPEP_0185542562 /NCGR_PEP_ID=MMETSP1381-20130426/2690_1 /TAXON_ID=298111 /ORGANISM="Pavlova sp., Strain CCMP459" /LENGTH=379 /DNA_ID=CAMNT_0028154573 /DNA_START=58 /DNA_END=1193 /DNA_ORIENTATION=+